MRTLRELVDRYVDTLATRLRPGTVRDERIHLDSFVAWMTERQIADVRAVTPQDIKQYRSHLLASPLAMRTRYDRLASVQRFFAWLVATRMLITDPAASVPRGRRGRWQPRNVLTEGEVVRMLESIDITTPAGVRDRAILELLYSTGLRRAELVALDLGEVDLAGGVVLVRSGKGGKIRLVPLGERAAQALLAYIARVRPLLLRRPGVVALLLAKAGHRLGASSILAIVKRAGQAAAIGRPVTPHMLRHAVATHLLCRGANLRHVQQLLGHNRIDTTETYTHLDPGDLARAHARAHPRGKKLPYR